MSLSCIGTTLDLFSSPATMSVTQNFDSYSSGNTAAGGAPNADFDLKDAQLDEASAGADGQSGILSGGIGQVAQNASQIVSLTLCVNRSCATYWHFLLNSLCQTWFSWNSS